MLNVASQMQSLRHGFAKRTTARISPLLALGFKCRTTRSRPVPLAAQTLILKGC
ncbi:MAG: hypothetical protein ACLFWI_27150 [Coleofasciculus sp.]|uniref:hypothetical protein n=1 Tax=Coleofasciculus sp. TaxID=3100458 RepID=UPI003A179068